MTASTPRAVPAGPSAAPGSLAFRPWVREAWAVFTKEWRVELRTRHALATVTLFALTTLLTVTLALGPLGVTGRDAAAVLPVILWILLLFAASAGLPRAFVHEEETGTAAALRLAAAPSAVFVGKLLFGLAVLLALEAVVVPLFLGMTSLPLERPVWLLAGLLGGAVGLAAASTLLAALVAQAQGRGALFPIVAFPVLLPLLLLAVELTRGAVAGPVSTASLGQLLLYDASIVVAGLMLFPLVWNP